MPVLSTALTLPGPLAARGARAGVPWLEHELCWLPVNYSTGPWGHLLLLLGLLLIPGAKGDRGVAQELLSSPPSWLLRHPPHSSWDYWGIFHIPAGELQVCPHLVLTLSVNDALVQQLTLQCSINSYKAPNLLRALPTQLQPTCTLSEVLTWVPHGKIFSQ